MPGTITPAAPPFHLSVPALIKYLTPRRLISILGLKKEPFFGYPALGPTTHPDEEAVYTSKLSSREQKSARRLRSISRSQAESSPNAVLLANLATTGFESDWNYMEFISA